MKPNSRKALEGEYEKMIINSDEPMKKGYNHDKEEKKEKEED